MRMCGTTCPCLQPAVYAKMTDVVRLEFVPQTVGSLAGISKLARRSPQRRSVARRASELQCFVLGGGMGSRGQRTLASDWMRVGDLVVSNEFSDDVHRPTTFRFVFAVHRYFDMSG